MKYSKILFLPMLLALIFGVGALVSCNESSSSYSYTSPVNLAVTNFTISGIDSQELDTVFFTIDTNAGLIFNADSLLQGTDVSKVVATISFSSTIYSAVIEMEGGTTLEGEIDYKENPTDSIDFTGNVYLHITADKGSIGMTYRIKVNVHEMVSDSLYWSDTFKETLPSRLSSPVAQKTVTVDGLTACMIEESDGTYTVSTCESLDEFVWTKTEVTMPFTPRLESLASSAGSLWILDTDGAMYTSSDHGATWTSTGETWLTVFGDYVDTLIGLRQSDGKTLFAQYPMTDLAESEIPGDFPVSGMSNFVTLSNEWTTSPVGFFVGGKTADGTLSDSTWAFDGKNWICLSSGGIPALEGSSLIPYYYYRASASSSVMLEYSVWMLVGGTESDGGFNRTVYISYDNGVHWHEGSEGLQLPDEIPTMTGCDNVVYDTEMSADLADMWKAATRVEYELDGSTIIWQCPYIYLFGGYSTSGTLYDTVWKGVLSRLTFTPII